MSFCPMALGVHVKTRHLKYFCFFVVCFDGVPSDPLHFVHRWWGSRSYMCETGDYVIDPYGLTNDITFGLIPLTYPVVDVWQRFSSNTSWHLCGFDFVPFDPPFFPFLIYFFNSYFTDCEPKPMLPFRWTDYDLWLVTCFLFANPRWKRWNRLAEHNSGNCG